MVLMLTPLVKICQQLLLRQVNGHTTNGIKSLDMVDRTSTDKDWNRIIGIDSKRSYRLSANLQLVAARLERQLKGFLI